MALSKHWSLVAGLSALAVAPVFAADKVTFNDDVLPVFRDHCLKCHNPDKQRGDLDLSTFGGALKGGSSGSSVNSGDPDGSMLFKVTTHAAEPLMPPNSPKIPEKQLDILRKWIEGGLLEGANSKAIAANKPKVDLTLSAAAIGKPDGPPPMPVKLSLEPAVVAQRQTVVSALAGSPWAPIIAVGSPKQVTFYRSADLEFLGVLPFPEGFPHDAKFSRNGKLLLVGGGRGGKSGDVAVWDITTGERVINITGELDSVLASDISSDQKHIVLGGPDKLVKLYSTADGSLETKIKKHTDWVTAAEFSPDSKFLVTGDRAGNLYLWESGGRELFALNGHKGAISSVSWRADSGLVLSSSEDGTLKIWNPRDGQLVRSINAHRAVLDARFSMDGRIASAGRDNKVTLWDVAGKNLRNLNYKGELPNRLTFSADSKRLFVADFSGMLSVWSTDDGNALGSLETAPPTLASRVENLSRELAARQQASDKAAAEFAQADAGLESSKERLKKSQDSLAAAEKAIPAKDKELAALREQAKAGPADDKRDAAIKALGEEIKKLKESVAKLGKETIPAERKAVDAASKKAGELKSVAERALADLNAVKSSLARWKAAQTSAPKKVASR